MKRVFGSGGAGATLARRRKGEGISEGRAMQEQQEVEGAACRVLLLEDDEPLRQRFTRILQEWPQVRLVAACATLAEALPHLRGDGVDLLITDLRLPDGHGTQAIRTLRSHQPQAEAMVISVLADDQSVKRTTRRSTSMPSRR